MILETKLTLPQPKAGSLLRTGLINLIKNNLDKKLILITAGAGYGKTTLLGQLIKQAKLPAVFYSLDNSDSDLTTFYSYLIAGLEKLSPGLSSRSAILLTQAGQTGNNHELLMGTLINELVEKRKEELFIVLDDYQYLAGKSPVHLALEYFIDHQPDIVHVIIASRSEADFPLLAKWIAKQDAIEVTRQDLEFSGMEIKELFASTCSQTPGEAEVKQVLDQTEGWITGIRLILDQAAGPSRKKTVGEILAGWKTGSSPVSDGELDRYFMNEILSKEPQKVRQYLKWWTILETISVDACAAVFGISAALNVLEGLVKRNMFISKVGSGEYKYHALFREFLQKADYSNIPLASLHRKAAAYYLKRKDPERAIKHYIDAACYKRALELFPAIAEEMLENTAYSKLRDLINKIPESHASKDPMILLVKGVLLFKDGKITEADDIYEKAESLLVKTKTSPGKRKKEQSILSDLLISKSSLSFRKGDFDKALKQLSKALRCCPRSNNTLKMNVYNSIGLVWSGLGNSRKAEYYLKKALCLKPGKTGGNIKFLIESNLANIYSRRDLKMSLNLFMVLLNRNEGRYFAGVGHIYYYAAMIAIELGDMQQAGNILLKGWEICRPYNDLRTRFFFNACFGAFYMEKEQWSRSQMHLENALGEAQQIQWIVAEIRLLIIYARFYRYCQNLDKAAESVAKAYVLASKTKSQAIVALRLEEAMIKIAQGQFSEADSIMHILMKSGFKYSDQLEAIKARWIKTAICLGQGKKKEAYRLMSNLITIARKNGCNGILMRELRHNQDLAGLAYSCRSERPYLDRIKHAMLPVELPAADKPVLKIQLLGNIQLSLAGNRAVPVKWRSRKEASLLAYLVLHRQRLCEREELMSALWPGSNVKRAGQSLYAWMSQLKRELANGLKAAGQPALAKATIIVHQERGYRINPEIAIWLDTDELSAQCEKAQTLDKEGEINECLDCCRRCVELYHGDLLNNLAERCFEPVRTKCEKAYLWSLARLARGWAEQGNHHEAIDLYCRYLEREPHIVEISENIHTAYWRELKSAGRGTEIEADYLRLKQLLQKDLGTEPQPETEEIYRELAQST